jgi:cyclopropane fatty-acyl-phospholipid synthase-like methyltransferase
MSSNKPFSQACENNKHPILNKLAPLLQKQQQVLEIGSGTGQHAVYFASELSNIHWQCSDRQENLDGIGAWIADAKLDNLAPPICLDVHDLNWPTQHFDMIYSANTLHIMSWHEVTLFFRQLKNCLAKEGLLCVYGPFNYVGKFSSPSNAQFDQWLKQRDHQSGIRDFEAIDQLAQKIGLTLQADHKMPANNQLLIWQAH